MISVAFSPVLGVGLRWQYDNAVYEAFGIFHQQAIATNSLRANTPPMGICPGRCRRCNCFGNRLANNRDFPRWIHTVEAKAARYKIMKEIK